MLHTSQGNTKNFVGIRRNATLEVVQTNCIWPSTSDYFEYLLYTFSKKKKKNVILHRRINSPKESQSKFLSIQQRIPLFHSFVGPTKWTKSCNNFRNILPAILLAAPFPRIPTRFTKETVYTWLSPVVIPFQHVRSSPCPGRCTFSSAKQGVTLASEGAAISHPKCHPS